MRQRRDWFNIIYIMEEQYMFGYEDALRIRKTVFDLLHFDWAGTIDVHQGDGLHICMKNGHAAITAQDKPALARAYFRLAQEASAGKTAFEVHESRHFDSCGAFLDFSRNGVMTVAAAKRYMDHIAALGLNLLVIYTEDTFTVPEYRYMGYLRGRLSSEEMQEMDDYAASLGIELVPCIQTLGHLEQFLQWYENHPLRDQPAVLMADDEKTYDFIEAEIRAVRKAFRGKRLHIGMDEAHGVGLGRYFYQNGPTDRFQLLRRHLDKVVALCEKYDFKPMMWSDMFFRLGSKTDAYYDMEADIPQSVIDGLPNVSLVYWDYYHKDEFWYEHMLTQHEKMCAEAIFAGGVWTWSGFLPQVDLTWETMEPALKVCARHKVNTVMATMWGDDGQETMHSLALNQLPIFSECCWRPEEADRETIRATGEFLTGLHRDAYEAFRHFYPGAEDSRPGKSLIWCDLLYPLGPQGDKLANSIDRAKEALAALAPYTEDLRCAYAAKLFEIIRHKGSLMQEIRARYLAGDKAWLGQMAEEDIPALMESYRELRDLHRRLWESEFKRNGWEVIALRYGAVMGRLEDVQHAVRRYADGELSSLCELDEEPLPTGRSYNEWYRTQVSPAYGL